MFGHLCNEGIRVARKKRLFDQEKKKNQIETSSEFVRVDFAMKTYLLTHAVRETNRLLSSLNARAERKKKLEIMTKHVLWCVYDSINSDPKHYRRFETQN